MHRIIGKAPSEQSFEAYLPKLTLERDRIREALLNFVPVKVKKTKSKKTTKKKKKAKDSQKTLMTILKGKGLTLNEAIKLIAAKEDKK